VEAFFPQIFASPHENAYSLLDCPRAGANFSSVKVLSKEVLTKES